MRALLQDLNSLPGVVGCMFCDAQTGVLSRAFPADFDDSSLTDVASALATSTPELKFLTGPIGVLDLRYREARVVIRRAGEASLVVLCKKNADVQEVLAFASVACRKFERLQNPGVVRPIAAAAPVPDPGTPALGTVAPAAPVPDPGAPALGTVAPAAPVPDPGTPALGTVAPAAPVPDPGTPALGTVAPAAPVPDPGTPALGAVAPAVPVPDPGTPALGTVAPAAPVPDPGTPVLARVALAIPEPDPGTPALGTAAPAVFLPEPGTPSFGATWGDVQAPGPETPVPEKITPVETGVRADRPRRRIPLAVVVAVVAALVLTVGAGAAYLTYTLVVPRPVPVAAVAPPPAPAPRAEPPVRPVEVKLRLSGADTLAAELAPAMAAAYLSAQKATDLRVTRPGPDVIVVQGVQDGAAVGVEIKPGATAQGLDDLLAGTADVALAARRVNAEERQKLSSLGSMTAAANEHVLGVDGITVVVNKANPVASLNREQLGLILSGALGDWSRLAVPVEASAGVAGGKGGPVASSVHVYLPEDRSGIPEVVQATVLGGKPFAKDAKRLPTPRAVAEAVSADPGGLGLVPMAAVAGGRAVPIADLRDPPRVPTASTVASEEYLLTHRLYLYTAQASSNPQVSQFVEFALSAEGQAVVRKAGFVELGAKIEPRLAVGVPAESASAVTGVRRPTGTGSPPANSHAQPEPNRRPETVSASSPEPGDGGAVAPPPPTVAPPPTPIAASPPTPIAAPLPTRSQPIAVEDAPPVYASGGYEKPQMAEQGCVQRAVRMPDEMLDRVAGKTITVKFAVGKDGAPGRFQMMTPGMPDRVGNAIWAAIQACKWNPGADADGGSAAIWVIMPFRFTHD